MSIKFFIGIFFGCFYLSLVAQDQGTKINLFSVDSSKAKNVLAMFISDEGLISFQNFSDQIILKSNFDYNRVYFFDRNDDFAHLSSKFSKSNNIYLSNSTLSENKPSLGLDKEENMEDVGLLDSLPSNYKIIEVKALKQTKPKRSGFNVQKVNKPETFIDEEKLKSRYASKENDTIVTSSKAIFENSAIFYGINESALTSDVKNYLSKIAIILINDKSVSLTIKAYTDANKELANSSEIAESRAENIIDFLMYKGVSFNQLSASIKGINDLINDCYPNIDCEEWQHQENRQVQLYLKFN